MYTIYQTHTLRNVVADCYSSNQHFIEMNCMNTCGCYIMTSSADVSGCLYSSFSVSQFVYRDWNHSVRNVWIRRQSGFYAEHASAGLNDSLISIIWWMNCLNMHDSNMCPLELNLSVQFVELKLLLQGCTRRAFAWPRQCAICILSWYFSFLKVQWFFDILNTSSYFLNTCQFSRAAWFELISVILYSFSSNEIIVLSPKLVGDGLLTFMPFITHSTCHAFSFIHFFNLLVIYSTVHELVTWTNRWTIKKRKPYTKSRPSIEEGVLEFICVRNFLCV